MDIFDRAEPAKSFQEQVAAAKTGASEAWLLRQDELTVDEVIAAQNEQDQRRRRGR